MNKRRKTVFVAFNGGIGKSMHTMHSSIRTMQQFAMRFGHFRYIRSWKVSYQLQRCELWITLMNMTFYWCRTYDSWLLHSLDQTQKMKAVAHTKSAFVCVRVHVRVSVCTQAHICIRIQYTRISAADTNAHLNVSQNFDLLQGTHLSE